MRKVLLVIIILIILGTNSINKQILIPDEAIRLRVLANSNTLYDQQIKDKVTKNLQTEMYFLLKDINDINIARKTINNNIKKLDNKIKNILYEEKYNLGHSVTFGYHNFPEKKYKGVVYKEGKYESLLVTLGSGEGNNWWCVLFPPLCLLEAEETIDDEIEYKSYIIEMIKKVFNR